MSKKILYKILDKREEVLKRELSAIDADDDLNVERVSLTAQLSEVANIRALFEVLTIAKRKGGFTPELVDLLDEMEYTETFFKHIGADFQNFKLLETDKGGLLK